MKIPKVDYDVYYKPGNSLVKLNLSVCEKSKITLSVPVSLTEDIDKLNSSSGYYNDICYTAVSEKGTDISLNDRKKQFIEKNKTVCQDNCIFSEYDYKKKKAKCSCDVKDSSILSFSNITINKTKLYNNFINIKNIANIKILVCYKELLNIKGIKYNIGCYLIIPILLLHIINIIIFYKNQINKIRIQIEDIIFSIKHWDLVVADEIRKKKKKKKRIVNKRKNNNKNKKGKEKVINMISPIDYYFLRKIFIKHYPPIKKNVAIKIIDKKKENFVINRIETIKNDKYNKIILNGNDKGCVQQKIIKKAKGIMAYNDAELNNLSYKLALKYDKRTYCKYYFSLLKIKHIVLFTFFNNNDYNSKMVKIDLFLLNFIIYFTVNALFFSDETMHKIYEDEGSFNFIYQLPQILYSSLISIVLNIILKLLALSGKSIIALKKNKNKDLNNLNEIEKNLNNKLNKKFISYFILSSTLLLFFFYYLSMFCAIYKNTQYHLIKDTLISFSLSLLYPFGIYLIPGVFRIPALSNKKRDYLYKLGIFFQII